MSNRLVLPGTPAPGSKFGNQEQLAHRNEFVVPSGPSPLTDNLLKTIGPLIIFKKVIGRGAFGEVHTGKIMKESKWIDVAVKLQERDTRKTVFNNELKFYQLSENWNESSIPKLFYYGTDLYHRVLAIELLGPSLERLFRQCGGRFSLKTTLLLADQMIACVEALHNKGFIHRDLKPDNFVMGFNGKESMVHLVDYGAVESYLDKNNMHKKERSTNTITGTLTYLSLNAHAGNQLSRKDDLISLFFIIAQFLMGKLPWQTSKEYRRFEEKIEEVRLLKGKKLWCVFHETPGAFYSFYYAISLLKFHQKPDYEFLRNLFRGLAEEEKIEYDFVFDWNLPKRVCKLVVSKIHNGNMKIYRSGDPSTSS